MNIKQNKYWVAFWISLSLAAGILLGNLIARNAQTTNAGAFYNKIDLVLELIKNNYVDSISTHELEEKSIPEILSKLDPHSLYIPAAELKEVREPLEGNFEGIGVQFNIKNDTVYIINTIAGGPSEKVGIQAGDKIITVDDSLIAGVHITNDMVIKKLKGPKGTKVRVGIKRNGEKELLPFTITRDKIPLYSISSAYMINDSIGYVKLTRFAITSADEFHEAVKKLHAQGMKKLIFDLRGNGGGILQAAKKIVDEFLPEGKLIVYTQGRSRPRYDYLATDEGDCENDDLVILVDSWSASASEIVAGAIQDNDRGLIIGRRTFGKGLVQEPITFNDGSAIRLTTARYYTPTGRCIQKPYNNGIQAYEEEVFHRMINGELEHADSIHIPDSLKYTTPGGKIVYGGGGIIPDIFVPVDTSYYSPYFSRIVNRGLIYQFSLQYTDSKRTVLRKFKDYKELTSYLEGQNLLSQIENFCAAKGIKPVVKDIAISKDEILLRAKAYIIRNIFDDAGFYPILNQSDNVVQKALEVLEKTEP